jgi:cob(I)alamin adenosyltransferase
MLAIMSQGRERGNMKARIYTKSGDKGTTSLVGGKRVSKGDARLEAYGTLDELNSTLGIVRAHLSAARDKSEFFTGLEPAVQRVQNNLFNIGSHLACDDTKMQASLPKLPATDLATLEEHMDMWESELPPLKNFILPGGSALAAYAHHARTVCRRAERDCVRLNEHLDAEDAVDPTHMIYLNRLSDWLFLLARQCNFRLKVEDIPWSK